MVARAATLALLALAAPSALGMANDPSDTTGAITLDGSGTTNPSKYYWEVMSLVSFEL